MGCAVAPAPPHQSEIFLHMSLLSAQRTLRLAGFASASEVNGPGRRIVIWVQGCPLDCPGCFNPGTHTEDAGREITVAALFEQVMAAREPETVGVTFSGGEPFEQAEALAALAALIREAWPEASLMAFTGHVIERLRGPSGPPGAPALLRHLDLLVDGPFDPWRPGRSPWRGSTNQRLWALSTAPSRWHLESAGPSALSAEVQISEDGEVLLSGFPSARLRRALASAL